jgi:hypothetical protein
VIQPLSAKYPTERQAQAQAYQRAGSHSHRLIAAGIVRGATQEGTPEREEGHAKDAPAV